MVETAQRLVEVWRGDFCESVHMGHVAVWHADAGLIAGWGDMDSVILPRSSAKMIQALPLVESGAADAAGLTEAHLALACASHKGAAVHVDLVTRWLGALGKDETALRCGAEWPRDEALSHSMIRDHRACDQRHNNCSGKHSGFLTLTDHLGAGADYIEVGHPVQQAVRAAFEDLTDIESPGYGIDGCSAPNFATTLSGFAQSMACFAAADDGSGTTRGAAMVRLRNAMMARPDLVAGEGGACTHLMRAMGPRAAIKTGAEAVYVAIVPEKRIGVAVKIADGATRASEAVITQLLVGLGVLDAEDPVARRYTYGPIRNRADRITGGLRLVPEVAGWRV